MVSAVHLNVLHHSDDLIEASKGLHMVSAVHHSAVAVTASCS